LTEPMPIGAAPASPHRAGGAVRAEPQRQHPARLGSPLSEGDALKPNDPHRDDDVPSKGEREK